MSWMMSCAAGPSTTPAAPWISKMAAACQMRSVSVTKRIPHVKEASMNSPWPIWISLRQS